MKLQGEIWFFSLSCLESLDEQHDVVVILAQFVRARDHFTLRNPLLQIVHLAVQLEQLQRVVQLCPPLASQVLQTRVEFVHLQKSNVRERVLFLLTSK